MQKVFTTKCELFVLALRVWFCHSTDTGSDGGGYHEEKNRQHHIILTIIGSVFIFCSVVLILYMLVVSLSTDPATPPAVTGKPKDMPPPTIVEPKTTSEVRITSYFGHISLDKYHVYGV